MGSGGGEPGQRGREPAIESEDLPEHKVPNRADGSIPAMAWSMLKLRNPMRNRLLALLLLAATVAVAPASRARSTEVKVNAELGGAWLVPDGPWDGRTVLIFHGLADDMNGPNDCTKRLAEALAAHGIASLRINFRGEGDRMRTAIESTFLTRLEDASAALDFVQKEPGVKADHLGMMGWSLGASTAIFEASRTTLCRTLVVWSAPGGDLYQSIVKTGPLAAADAEAEKTGIASYESEGWKTMTLKKAFFDSFKGFDTNKALAAYHGAFLALRGTNDFLPPRETEFLRSVAGRPAEAVTIAGADHIFNVFDPKSHVAERGVDLTLEWLQKTL